MAVAADPIETDTLRLRHEFLSMPTLCLTVPQVTRLLDLRVERAVDLLTALERDGFLMRTHNGAYRRAQPPLS